QWTLLDGATEGDQRSLSVAGGQLVAYSCRAPDKDTDNEDAVAVIPYGDDAAVLVVADGAGGLPGGRRASQTAVTELARSLAESRVESALVRTAVLNGIEAANRAVLDLGTGAATTLTVVAVEGRTARTFQIGDSEALIVGNRGLIRAQTMAHSPTGFAVEAGFLGEREALHHEERHLVSNFMGTSDMRIDMGAVVDMQARDTIMVASDGVTDNIHVHEVVDIIRKGPLPKAIDALIRLATHRMNSDASSQPSKPDDLSVILFRKPPVRRRAGANGGGPQ
ncbi:MAG: protein phosphatase 2C domain-containing protein, partial [Woeseia sp.]|nr:protein phosphatase 2C domain-containing protein [Woeseia sp.]